MRSLCYSVVALVALTAASYACPSVDPTQAANAPTQIKHDHRPVRSSPRATFLERGQGSGDLTFAVTLALVVTALGSVVAIAGPAVDARRSRARRRRTDTPLDLRLVDRLARGWRARGIVTAIVAMVAAIAVIATMKDPAVHVLMLVGPVVAFVRSAAIAYRAQIAIAHLRDVHVTASYDGSRFIFLLAGDQLVGWLVAWPSTLDRELARGVPTATARG